MNLDLTFIDLEFAAKMCIIKVKESQRQKNKLKWYWDLERDEEMRISDSVANYILQLLNAADGTAEIQRNELANLLGCVPSQINYVLSSRFTPEQGYLVESRRGGGGYIRITRMQITTSDMIMHISNAVGDELDAGTVRAMCENMVYSGVLGRTTAAVVQAATSEKALVQVPRELRDRVRAAIFKNVLLAARM